MAGRDISDMSFDEFFLGKKSSPKRERPKPAEGQDAVQVMDGVRKACKKVEPDCEIFL